MKPILIALVLMISSSAHADGHEDNLFFDVSSTFATDYMFRGFNLYDGATIQPSGTAGIDLGDAGAISANVWAHLSAEGAEGAEGFTEVDYTLSYDVSLGPVAVSVGHIWFTFPDDDDDIKDTAEFFAAASLDTILSPSVSVYHDYDEFDAQYYELGLSHTFDCGCMGEGFNMTPFVNFGFASSADGVYTDNGHVQTTFGAYFDMNLGDIAVSPSLNYTLEADDSASDEFWVAISFSYSS